MKLFEYKSVSAYRSFQINHTLENQEIQWVTEHCVAFLSGWLTSKFDRKLNLGVCHGVRKGREIEWFGRYLNCEVWGTEICPECKGPFILNVDFNQVIDEWINQCDFIYSNSLDHSYDPEKTLYIWKNYLVQEGWLLVEWGVSYEVSEEFFEPTEVDCFRCSTDECCDLLKSVIQGPIKLIEFLGKTYIAVQRHAY